jgi:hypothetical protein
MKNSDKRSRSSCFGCSDRKRSGYRELAESNDDEFNNDPMLRWLLHNFRCSEANQKNGSNFHKFADSDGRIVRVRRVKIPNTESAGAICRKMSNLIDEAKKWTNGQNLIRYRYVKADTRTNHLYIVTEYFDLNFEGMCKINYTESDIREIVEQILRARLALEENKCPNICIKPKHIFAHTDGTIRVGGHLKYKQFFQNTKQKIHSVENEASHLIQIMKRLTFGFNRTNAYSKEFIDFLRFLNRAAADNSTETAEFFNHRWMRTNMSKLISTGLSFYQRPAQPPENYSLNMHIHQQTPYFASDKPEKVPEMTSDTIQDSLPRLMDEAERERQKQERAKKFKEELLGHPRPGMAVDKPVPKSVNFLPPRSNTPTPQSRPNFPLVQNQADAKKAIFQEDHDKYMYDSRMKRLCANIMPTSPSPVIVPNVDLTLLSRKLNPSDKTSTKLIYPQSNL